jgi:hypothetical protein
MRFGSTLEHRGFRGVVLAALALTLVVALALVAPTNGLCNPELHELVLVHPIFSHHHDQDPHAAHRDADASLVGRVVTAGASLISPAGPFGAGLGLAYESMLAASPISLLLSLLAVPLLAAWRPLDHQAWIAVPTGPPR